MKNLVKQILSNEDLTAIASAIGTAEKTTAGEIRVSIRQKRKWRERKQSLEELARQEFHMLGMTKTKDRTGILVFLLLEDKKFYILADEGIHSQVADGVWDTIAKEMSEHFSQKNFRLGIVHGVQSVGAELSKYFPRKSDDTNELPDDVRVR
ncbi:MAG: TPM domain-containing protein [Ignavibacteriae bacterium]|nr:MAG: TPM domain-containing protein [Ignavibacteriota bacterium]